MYRGLNKPTLVLLLFVAAGCRRTDPPVVSDETRPPVSAPLRVRLTGSDFRWHIRYPGPDHRLDTPDDLLAQRHLHLPTDRDIQLELRSDDFVYSLYLPDYELVEMAVPGRPFLVEFRTDAAGTSRLLGTQMCGFTHKELLGDLVVLSPTDFLRWMERE